MRRMYRDPDLQKVIYQLPDGTKVQEYSVEQVMLRPNTRPFFMFAASNSGKTVIATDMFTKAMQTGQYNQFQYITGNYDGEGNKYLRNKILKATCYTPSSTEDFIEHLDKVVSVLQSEIQNRTEIYKIIEFTKSLDYPKELEQIQVRLQQKYLSFKARNPYDEIQVLVFNNSVSSAKTFMEIYKQMDFDSFITMFNSNQQSLKNEITSQAEIMVSFDGEEVSKQKALNIFIQKVNKEYNQYQTDKLNQYKSILKKEFVNLIQDEGKRQKILEYFQNLGNESALPEHIKKLCNYIQDPFRACIILDDVSDFAEGAQKSTSIIKGKKGKELYSEIMATILTKGRHIGNIFIALHNPNQLPPAERQQMGNIILNPQACTWLQTYKLFDKDTKSEISQILSEIDEYRQNNGVRYNLVVFRDASESPDGQSKYCLMAAQYNESQQFDAAIYSKNKYFKYLAEQQLQGVNVEDSI